MKPPIPPTLLATGLALAASTLHLFLGFFNAIPGEATAGPLFLGMGVVYLAALPILFRKKSSLYPLIILYAFILIVAYASSRDGLPVEPIGLLTKIIEGALIATTYLLYKKQ